MRLVDADMLKKNIPTEEINARIALATAPTIEAEPIVRCKDCKYFKTYPPTEDQDYTIYDCERLNYCTDNAVGNKPEDFCSRGESTMGQLK